MPVAHPARLPPRSEHQPRAAAGTAATPFIDRMVQQQPVQRGARPEQVRPHPTRSTPLAPGTVHQDRAQCLNQEFVIGLVDTGAPVDHWCHAATA